MGDERDAEGHQRQSDQVCQPGLRGVCRDAAGKHEDEGGDGEVEPEHPLPGEALSDEAADEGADGDGDAGDRTPDTDDLAAPLGRCSGGDDGEGERHAYAAGRALHRARSHQDAERRGERTQSRGDGEQGDADREHPASPEAVAQHRPSQDRDGECESVGVHDPGEVIDACTEVVADVGEHSGHHEGVKADHERGERAGQQGCDAGRLGRGCGGHDDSLPVSVQSSDSRLRVKQRRIAVQPWV